MTRGQSVSLGPKGVGALRAAGGCKAVRNGPGALALRLTRGLRNACLALLVALAAMVAGAPAQAQDATNADLFGINLSQGALTSPFNPATTSYTVNVPNGVASLGVTAIASDSAATVSINGAAARTGSAGSNIALAVGQTPSPSWSPQPTG